MYITTTSVSQCAYEAVIKAAKPEGDKSSMIRKALIKIKYKLSLKK